MHSDKIKVKKIPAKLYKNELPRTLFIDELDAVRVKLIDYPNTKLLYKKLYDIAFISWGSKLLKHKGVTKRELLDTVKAMLDGNTLPLGLEMLNFTFAIGPVSRIATHMIVRHRIGFSFAQKSTGNSDLRHDIVLVPRIFGKYKKLYDEFKKLILQQKMLYAKLVDSNVSVQDARAVLTQYTENNIIVHCSLLGLINFVAKRLDTAEEPLIMNRIADLMRQEVIKKYPIFAKYFVSACERGTCLLAKNHMLANCLYIPDKLHDKFLYNKRNFLYDKTRTEMCYYKKGVEPELYIGFKKVKLTKKMLNKMLENWQ